MANTPGGSFIPKRSTGKVTPVRSGKRIYIFSYIAYVFFFGTLLSVVGIFFLNSQAEKQLQSFISKVEEQQQSFNRGQIDTIRKLDSRIKTAEQVLGWHVAPSRLFEELEAVIVKTVRLQSFTYTRTTGGGAVFSFGGLTDTFDVLLFQRDVLENSPMLAAADIVEVSYGSGDNSVIEGAQRGAAASVSTVPGKATVSFSFQDDAIVSSIGYVPRQGSDRQSDNTAVNLEEVSTDSDANADTGVGVDDNVIDQ